MSSNYHTPIAPGAPANAATFNTPMADLDQAISDIVTGALSLEPLYAAADHDHPASAIVSGVLANARVNWAAPGAIGTTTPDAGKFTDLEIDGSLNHDGSTVGFYNTTPVVKPTVSGNRLGNPAMASLLAALAGQGLIADSTTLGGTGARSNCPVRLSVHGTEPIPPTDVLGVTSIFCHPFGGTEIELYDGSSWVQHTLANAISIAMPATTNTNYDVFIYNNSGTLTLELTAWASNTARATALAYQNGVRVKSGSPTRRYLGTVRTTGVSGQLEDSAKRRFVFNAHNKIQRVLRYAVNLDGHTYVGGWRPWNTNTAVRAEIVLGEATSVLTFVSAYILAASGVQGQVGVGLDTTAAATENSFLVSGTATAIQSGIPNFWTLAEGYHYLQLLEYAFGGSATFYNGAVDAMVMI